MMRLKLLEMLSFFFFFFLDFLQDRVLYSILYLPRFSIFCELRKPVIIHPVYAVFLHSSLLGGRSADGSCLLHSLRLTPGGLHLERDPD